MEFNPFVIAIVLYIVAAGCALVAVLISLQQSRQPGWDSNKPPTARFRQRMGAGAALSLIGATLMLSTVF